MMSSIACGCLRLNASRLALRIKLNGTSFRKNGIGRNSQPVSLNSALIKDIHTSPKSLCIVDGKGGSHKPTPFQSKILVWTKAYESEADIPERITRNKMKYAMDKFRVKVLFVMIALTFIFSAVMALIGRKERNDGNTLTKISLAKREQ